MKAIEIFLLLCLSLNTGLALSKAPEVKWNVLDEYNLKTKKVGANLKKVLGKKIKISGFMIPLDYSSKTLKEFLLLPYYPSCSHVPPPPANQIIKVNIKKGAKHSYYPVTVEGIVQLIKKSKKVSPDPYLPEGVFEMEASKVIEIKE